VLSAAVAAGLLTSGAAPATAVAGGAGTTMARTWGVDGRVLAVLPVGEKVVVAGSFANVVDTAGRTHPAANVALFDRTTGRFDTGWGVATDKAVNAVAVDGSTLYLGGAFRTLNGTPERGLGAVDLASGARVATFVADVADKEVTALAVDGGRVYAGGSFSKVTDATGTRVAPFLARFDASTGRQDTTYTPGPNDRVNVLLATGSGVYVGGDFTAVGGVFALTRLFRTDAAGVVDPVFRAGPTNDGARAPVMALAPAGEELLVGSGGSGGGCAVLDATTGATRWSKHGNGNVVAVSAIGAYAYCGGHFNGSAGFDGLTRTKLASVVLATGATTADAPVINSPLGVWSMAADDAGLYLGGDFTKVGATTQPRFGVFVLQGRENLPQAPTSVVAAGADRAVALTWVPPSHDGGTPVRTYRVWRSTASSAPVLVGSTRQTSLVDTSVADGVTYVYTVQARTAVGDSVPSAPVEAEPRAVLGVPGAPTGLTATGQLGSAALGWTLPDFDGGTSLTGLRVLRSTVAGAAEPLVDLGPTATSFTDHDVVVGVRYYYAVSALNAVGESPPSTQATAVPDSGEPTAPALSATAGAGTVDLAWTPTSHGAAPITRYVVIRDGIRLVTLTGDQLAYTDRSVVAGREYGYQVKAQNAYGTSRLSALVRVVPS
jgi:fibronectin type 3 domain-containing protein